MKKEINNEMEDELHFEYDFSKMKGGIKGKYIEQYCQGTNLALLDPDVAKAFPTEQVVNEALRGLIQTD